MNDGRTVSPEEGGQREKVRGRETVKKHIRPFWMRC